MMIPINTLKLLHAWGRWGNGHSIGYPSLSPMFGNRALKSPLYGKTHIPDGIAEIEHAVCRLEYTDRYIIIQRHCRHCTYREIAKMVGVSTWRAGRLLKAAEAEVHRQYELILDLRDALAVQTRTC